MPWKLGDRIHEALNRIGITEERVQKVLGDCNCAERRKAINDLSDWAENLIIGKVSEETAKTEIEAILHEESKPAHPSYRRAPKK